MFEVLERTAAELEGVVRDFEPRCLTGSQAAEAVALFARIERLVVAGKAVAAGRVEETSLWRQEGFRSAASWMGAKTGTTTGQALGNLEAAKRMERLPATAGIFRSGRLSEAQAKEISQAAEACPEAEAGLLVGAAATTTTMSELRDQCRQVTAAADDDDDERREQIHRLRYLRHWTDSDGAFRLDARLRTALEARDPTCVVPGCDVRQGLEIDHVVPITDGGNPCLANLARLCPPPQDEDPPQIRPGRRTR
ncbi:MAG: DUF222 domain-containing protein [Acidimicrobiia bacterium]